MSRRKASKRRRRNSRAIITLQKLARNQESLGEQDNATCSDDQDAVNKIRQHKWIGLDKVSD